MEDLDDLPPEVGADQSDQPTMQRRESTFQSLRDALGEHQRATNDPFYEHRKEKAVRKLQQMYRYPSLAKLADYHQRANKLGFKAEWIDYQGQKRKAPPCPCCDKIITTAEFPLCYDTSMHEPKVGEDKEVIPLGVSIYFSFVKMVILLLAVRFLMFDAYVFFSSIYGNYCVHLYETNAKYLCSTTLSGYNLKSASNQPQLNIVNILSFAFVLFSICYFMLFRKILHNYYLYTHGKEFADNNFSILV
jgi:hypothetical protein